ncbi:T9SS type A sorting domain-containing protein [Niastella sp. OAS944]|uniref:T9SS type A sorting domain-containing protein n=1 Tax=Niastella sp. OAS944 TaxID=2664089 RepID=UPI003499425B|nr:hypothetical protein [Chitinophagaceae bacterium OAS944]
MSKLYPKPKQLLYFAFNAFLALLMMLAAVSTTQAQGLEFKDASLVQGREGQDGAVYKFPNVAPNVNGFIKIAGRSSSAVKLSTIDLTSTGFNKAFQPHIAYEKKNAGKSERDWWLEFEISFHSTIDSTPVTISTMDLTALDIDGDDDINEWVALYNLTTYTTEQRTSLSVDDLLENILSTLTLTGKKFSGPNKDYSGIDTSATKLMATAQYLNKNKMRVRAGGHSDNRDIDTERMYSFWFKSFTYQAPVNGTLPVVLSAFTAKKNGSQAVLNWTTDVEEHVSHFVVEKSLNGTAFNEAGVIFTEGNNSTLRREYSFKDDLKAVTSGFVYYRMKIVDMDGKYEHSATRIIKMDADNTTAKIITVYPNPVTGELRITLAASWQDKAVSIQLMNANGQNIKRISNNIAGQTATVNVSGMAPGIYLLQVSDGKETAVQRFIKTK